jgi:hypothetical protein
MISCLDQLCLDALLMTLEKATSIALFTAHAPDMGAKTAIVIGVTRGGTTMIAGAVRGFGFFYGNELPVNNEDPEFSYKPLKHMKSTIQKRNEEYSLWGWKFPMAANYLDDLFPELRNPYLIIVTRDLAATASALTRWHSREPTRALAEVLLQSERNLSLALRWRVPTLLVSYERASLYRDAFLSELESFLAVPLVVDRSRLLAFMEPGTYKSFDEIVLSLP